MPRAPQRSALFAGRPFANRAVLIDQRVAHPVDALQEFHLDAVDPGYRLKSVAGRLPDERFRASQVDIARFGRGEPLQRPRNAIKFLQQALVIHGGTHYLREGTMQEEEGRSLSR